jgi:hypothetical protein
LAFDADGRLHVPNILDAASAERLHGALAASRDWVFVFNRGDKHFELTQENAARTPKEALLQMQRDIFETARDGFQLASDVVNVSKRQTRCSPRTLSWSTCTAS